MNITINKKAQKYINKLPKNLQSKIINAIQGLPMGDVINMTNADSYRLMVGGLRVIFTAGDNCINIKAVSPRGQVYK